MKYFFSLILLAAVLSLPVCAVSTSAKAAAVINGDTGELIFEQNADEKLPMASTTKIMTALILCEMCDLSKEITVTEEMLRVEGSSMGLLAGDRVTFHDLLYGMLLASGNDAANVTAFAVAGGTAEFAELMNARAAELGLKSTRFVTPSGLDAEGHFTTARELALLAAHALKNESFAAAAASKSATLCYGNPPYKRSLTNHNKLLSLFEGAIGVKTGYTKKSGRCLVSAARQNGKLAIAVTLNDPNDWADHTALLNYGLKEIKQTVYSPKISACVLPVIGAASDEALEIAIEPHSFNTLNTESISCKIHLPRFVYAPIASGEKLGTAEYYLGDRLIATDCLTSPRDIAATPAEKSPAAVIADNFKYIFLSI